MFSALVLDQHAIPIIATAAISREWLQKFDLPKDAKSLKRFAKDGVVYILSSQASENSRLLVIDLQSEFPLLKLDDPVFAFDRILHVALSTFEPGVAIPLAWHCFRDGSRLSIFAARKRTKERVHFEQHPDGTNNLFAFAVTPDVRNPVDLLSNEARFRKAYDGLADALLAENDPEASADESSGIVLTIPKGALLAGGHTLQDWYDRVLTAEQRRFVNRELTSPVRLKGAAGTGKTLAMAVKCLRDFYRLADEGRRPRFAFITHSTASVTDVVRPMLEELDPSKRWMSIDGTIVDVASLYEIAQTLSRYEQKLLVPLSLDGREGRDFQRLLILDAIEECVRSTWFVHPILSECSDGLRSRFDNRAEWDFLALELMHEFASVVDAERIRLGRAAADEYLKRKREAWQMNLASEEDRRAVLGVHDAYCRRLENENVLSMDQMISDLNIYLLSHEWARLRERLGYDVVFVDELHYFNRAERMVFHSLFRRPRATDGGASTSLPLFMAYDIKQSVSDTFLNSAADSKTNWTRALQAGPTQLDELTEIFRYSPEIAKFLGDMDAAFPTLDLEAEWAPLSSASRAPNGDVPELQTYERSVSLLDNVFAQAERDARELGGRNVAVLCMNEGLFGQYVDAGRIAGKFIAVESREKLSELKYIGKKCIFSLPDYVAGLQFDTVYLIHLDDAELGDERENVGVRRRFISRAYLGASRARSRLFIATSQERGGPSEVLDTPIARGSVRSVSRT